VRTFATVQERILDRALYLIGTHGDYDVPIRDITKAANVNVNAINYYFGNKENLIREVERFFIANYRSAYAVLDSDEKPEQKLLLWANEVMEYTLQYPGIQRLQQRAIKSPEPGEMKAFLLENAHRYDEAVLSVLKNLLGDRPDLQMIKLMFYSAIIHPANFGTEVDFGTNAITDRQFRLEYIRAVVETIQRGIKRHEI
jgi:AcrR family transcriptional regulator